MKTEYAGIDYGLGKTNIDIKKGIRYGVIPIHDLNEWAWEEFEGQYGDPCCPECGNTVEESCYGKDYFCNYCYEVNVIPPEDGSEDEEYKEKYCYWSEECYPEQALSWLLDNGEYLAEHGEDCDIFILKSPYYTHAQFCSPCAPGACYLRNPVDSDLDNNMCYCFGHDWFEDEKAPYPVYSVETGELVEANDGKK